MSWVPCTSTIGHCSGQIFTWHCHLQPFFQEPAIGGFPVTWIFKKLSGLRTRFPLVFALCAYYFLIVLSCQLLTEEKLVHLVSNVQLQLSPNGPLLLIRARLSWFASPFFLLCGCLSQFRWSSKIVDTVMCLLSANCHCCDVTSDKSKSTATNESNWVMDSAIHMHRQESLTLQSLLVGIYN